MRRAELQIVLKLVLAQARSHPGRIALAVAATMASVCVVVWVVSGYDALVQRFAEFSDEYLGRYQLLVVPRYLEDPTGFGHRKVAPLSSQVIDSLHRDPVVAVVDPVYQQQIRIARPEPRLGENKLKSDDMPTLVGTDAREPPYSLVEGKWIDSRHPEHMEAAISHGAAQRLKVRLGDELLVSGGSVKRGSTIRIVGIVEQSTGLPPTNLRAGMPSMRADVLYRGPADAALYVPVALAQKLVGRPLQPSFVGLVLKDGVAVDEWRACFAVSNPTSTNEVDIQSPGDVAQELDTSATTRTIRTQAYAATGVALLAALFIILATLSMGVHERAGQFAVLRAVALTKSQVAGMVAAEAVLLGLFGWLGGLLAGFGLVQATTVIKPGFLPAGASLGFWTVALSGAGAVGGSLLASVVPAWKATTTRPLDAMTNRNRAPSRSFKWPLLAIGATFVAVNPILTFYAPVPDAACYVVSAVIGDIATAVGIILLAPSAVVLAEEYLARMIAPFVGCNPRLLAGQLSANLWRTLGTTLALSLGLGMYVAMQVWGYSMLAPFLPGRWIPDVLVTIAPRGISPSQVESIAGLPGIARNEVLPLAVEQAKFAKDLTGARLRPSVTRQDNCIVVGVDPDRALGGDQPMLAFRFIEGTRAESLGKLNSGRYCLVPDHFQRESGLGIGDKLAVIPPESPGSKVEYEIAGVVSMNGWHLASKGGLRTRSSRSAALVIASYEVVRHDFQLGPVRFLWMNLVGISDDKALQAALQRLIDQSVDGDGDVKNAKTAPVSRVRVQSTATLRATIQKHAHNIIWGLSKLPLVTLLVTSLGVTNTVLASVRARRWEFSILRAVGITRFGLIRLIMAEAIVVGAVACLLSFGFGVVTGYCGTEVTRYVDVHGGLITPMVIPWSSLAVGFGATLLLCLLAAVAPAVAAGRAEPLQTLSAGRSVL